MENSQNNFKFHLNNSNVDDTGIRVVVSGFGPFAGHPINASWEAVKKLQLYSDKFLSQISSDNKVTVYAHEIPVEYKKVDEIVPNLWSTYKPDLVVHLGVSRLAHTLTLEQCANNCGYVKNDVSGFCPSGNACIDNGSPVIHSSLEMDPVVQNVTCTCDIKPEVSTDPGRYLCEYVYYLSLNTDRNRCAFIHVPDFNVDGWTSDKVAEGVAITIGMFLKQIQKNIGFVKR